LATSRLSSNSPDWLDVSEIVKAFEEMNRCGITLLGRVEPLRGSKELVFVISAWDTTDDVPEATQLASVKCHLGSGGHRTMESAIMWALYQLDWQLAALELEKTKQTK